MKTQRSKGSSFHLTHMNKPPLHLPWWWVRRYPQCCSCRVWPCYTTRDSDFEVSEEGGHLLGKGSGFQRQRVDFRRRTSVVRSTESPSLSFLPFPTSCLSPRVPPHLGAAEPSENQEVSTEDAGAEAAGGWPRAPGVWFIGCLGTCWKGSPWPCFWASVLHRLSREQPGASDRLVRCLGAQLPGLQTGQALRTT